MTTLSAQIETIKAQNISKANMKKAIMALGVTSYEADLLTADIVKVNGVSYTFGVEIEMLAPRGAITERARANGMPIAYEGYNHRDNKSYFKFVSDASIQGENPIECVSPVLSSKGGFAKLKNACKTINEAGAMVNRSTGLHVHIGAENLTDDQYTAVFVNYQNDEACMIHFRLATHGSIRRANCHPFKIGSLYFAHNGVLPITPDLDKTDSETAFNRYLAKPALVYGLHSEQLSRAVESIIGTSKFAFMQGADIATFGKFVCIDGVLYSNTRWQYYMR